MNTDGQKNNKQKISRHLSEEQKRDITDILNSIFNKSLNLSSRIITKDKILNGVEGMNTKQFLK